jgi:hypothetical protein
MAKLGARHNHQATVAGGRRNPSGSGGECAFGREFFFLSEATLKFFQQKKKKKKIKNKMSGCPVAEGELRNAIRRSLVTPKSFACPIALRVAWHASGTFDPSDTARPGGSDGATMRFEPEVSDPANAGLGIVRDMLHGARKEHPRVSMADMWGYAGCVSSELMGGPPIVACGSFRLLFFFLSCLLFCFVLS